MSYPQRRYKIHIQQCFQKVFSLFKRCNLTSIKIMGLPSAGLDIICQHVLLSNFCFCWFKLFLSWMCYHVLVVALSRSAGDLRPLIWWPSRHTLLSQAHSYIILIFGLFVDLKLRGDLLYNEKAIEMAFQTHLPFPSSHTDTYFPSFLFLVKDRAIKLWQLYFDLFFLFLGNCQSVCQTRIWDPTTFTQIIPSQSRVKAGCNLREIRAWVVTLRHV